LGFTVKKTANAAAPLTGQVTVTVSNTGAITIKSIQDYYEVHYSGNRLPAGCSLQMGSTSGWWQVPAGGSPSAPLYTIAFPPSTLNPASPVGSAQNLTLAAKSTSTWSYRTNGQVSLPPTCPPPAPNSMRNVINVTTTTASFVTRSQSFTPTFQIPTPTPTN